MIKVNKGPGSKDLDSEASKDDTAKVAAKNKSNDKHQKGHECHGEPHQVVTDEPFENIEDLILSRKAAEAEGSDQSYFQVFDKLFREKQEEYTHNELCAVNN